MTLMATGATTSPRGRKPGMRKLPAILLATAAAAVIGLAASTADAAPKKKRVVRSYDGPTRTYNGPVNYSYRSGPRTRVYVTRRSWLDAGTEVLPGERKFTDYALPPGYSYGRTIDRLYQNRQPLGDRWDTGTPFPFPLY